MLNSFLFNNVLVKHVPFHGQNVHPVTGIAFYVNNGEGGVIGVRVYPDGRKVLVNATFDTTENSKYNANRKQRYLHFKDVWGTHKSILASHAVHLAWVGPIPAGMTIDHINGVSTDNRACNLRCVSNAVNNRDGAFLRKLKAAGFDPTRIEKPYLLRYFDRMVEVKNQLSKSQYRDLTKAQLRAILYDPEFDVEIMK